MTQKDAILIKRTQIETLIGCSRLHLKEAADQLSRIDIGKTAAGKEICSKMQQMFIDLSYLELELHELETQNE